MIPGVITGKGQMRPRPPISVTNLTIPDQI